jgi:NTE family protein
MDGGVSNNAPISQAVAQGATTVYVLPTGYACTLDRPPRSALGMALHAITLLVQQRLAADAARCWEGVILRVVPPLCPLAVSPVDFSHSAELIDRAHDATLAWLERDIPEGDPASLLAPHQH